MAITGLGSGVGATLGDGVSTYSQVISIGVGGHMIDIVDISSSGSASQCMEFLPGLINPGSIVVMLRYGGTGGNTADGSYTTLSASILARTIATWTLTFPGGATWACSGFISKLGIATHYRGGSTIPVTIKCTGLPTFTAAA